jgi:hypothetical protein
VQINTVNIIVTDVQAELFLDQTMVKTTSYCLLFKDTKVLRLYTVMIGCLMNTEHLVERELAREAYILREDLPQCHFVHHISHMT